jgi:8-oxo-dGTP pyrophosphatase MutT (NUDIX family)
MQNAFLFDPADANGPVLRPKDAAALILVRREGDAVRVLMGERSARHAFLPGRFVFPGGRLDIGDQRLAVDTDLRPEVLAKVATGTTTSRARGLALAAVRETFEETGILVGRKQKTTARVRPRGGAFSPWEPRHASKRWSSSPARSRRPAARGASTRASSWPMRMRSPPHSIRPAQAGSS